MVEAHGTFRTNHCVGCRQEYSMEWAKEQIFADNVPTCTNCNRVVKPDIVFFGKDLIENSDQIPIYDIFTIFTLIKFKFGHIQFYLLHFEITP